MGWTGSAPASMCHIVAVDEDHSEDAAHGRVITVGLDIAKHVFQVHGIDDQERS
jgi:hypothetical protein